MKQPIEITIAGEKDIPALCALLNLLFSQEIEFTPNTAAQQRGLLKIIQNPQLGFILIGKVNEQTAAMVNILFTVSTALGERVAILEDMVVSTTFRGSGIGSQLITHAIQEAKNQQCKRITLLTDISNTAAQKFYQKHGFNASTMIPLRLNLD
jgi:ribosomal protein S18 acetylase RimI-like enzyme